MFHSGFRALLATPLRLTPLRLAQQVALLRAPRRRAAAQLSSCALALLLGVGAAASAPIVVHDDRGVALALAASPQRIISLLPSLTESVCALGGCARLVGIDRFSDWPASVRRLPRLGGLDDAQVERIVALKPDLVLAAPAARVIDRLEALGVNVMVLESRNTGDLQRTLGVLARLLGTPEAAAQLAARIDAEVAAAAALVPPTVRGESVYFEVDATPYAAAPGSFIGQLLARLGMANAVPGRLGPFPKLNPELVVRAQPDIVIAPRRDLAGMAARPGWAALHALQQHRTCTFTDRQFAFLTRPGPRLGEAAQLLAECFAALPPKTR